MQKYQSWVHEYNMLLHLLIVSIIKVNLNKMLQERGQPVMMYLVMTTAGERPKWVELA